VPSISGDSERFSFRNKTKSKKRDDAAGDGGAGWKRRDALRARSLRLPPLLSQVLRRGRAPAPTHLPHPTARPFRSPFDLPPAAPDSVRVRCRFEDEDLRVLEAALSAGADVPALLATRSAARSLLQASAAEAFASTATGSVLDGGRSLAVADFFARAFALVGDVEVSTQRN